MLLLQAVFRKPRVRWITLTFIVGCGGVEDLVLCPAALTPAIIVEVVVAGTGNRLGYETRGLVQDGSYSDSLYVRQFGNGLVTAWESAYDRAGTYSVRIEHAGFEPWSRDGIVVADRTCGVETVEMVARLRRAVE